MKNAAVLMEDGEFALIFRPHPRNLPYPEVKKVLMHGGQAQMEGGALGAASIDQCIIGSTSSLIPPRSWTSKPGQNLLFKIKRFKMRTGNKIQAWPVHLPKTPCAPCFLRRCLGTTGPWAGRKTREMGRVIKAIQHGDLSLQSSVSSAADFTVL